MLTNRIIKVAIIDDDEDDFLIIADYIKAINPVKFIIDWCDNYQTAIEKIKDNAYDIYFVDYRLGSETGLELLKQAAVLGCDAPFVVLTGKGSKDIDIAAMQSGATDYLIKSELTSEKLERCMRYSLDRAAALRELKTSETRYRHLFEGSKDAVFIVDEHLCFTEVNKVSSLLFHTERHKLKSTNLLEFIKNDKERKYIIERVKKGHDVYEIEVEVTSANSETKPCLLSLSFYEATRQRLLHGILHDITNIKKAELANLQTQKLEANERLMRILAHEIRNPLNNIGLSVDNIQLPPDAGDKQKNLLSIIQRNVVRINHIITELLNLSKPGELSFEKYSLQEILDESIATAADRINLQKIAVEKTYPQHPAAISADKSKLKIAFTNILINAIEAMESNKGELKVCITEEPNNYFVSIKDNGHGIPSEYMSKLFEPFFTSKPNGMGLGLSASHSIIQSHHGQLQVESKVNEGTNFIVSFSKSFENN
jgi:PAS domain S-box-containing protein